MEQIARLQQERRLDRGIRAISSCIFAACWIGATACDSPISTDGGARSDGLADAGPVRERMDAGGDLVEDSEAGVDGSMQHQGDDRDDDDGGAEPDAGPVSMPDGGALRDAEPEQDIDAGSGEWQSLPCPSGAIGLPGIFDDANLPTPIDYAVLFYASTTSEGRSPHLVFTFGETCANATDEATCRLNFEAAAEPDASNMHFLVVTKGDDVTRITAAKRSALHALLGEIDTDSEALLVAYLNREGPISCSEVRARTIGGGYEVEITGLLCPVAAVQNGSTVTRRSRVTSDADFEDLGDEQRGYCEDSET